MRSAGVAPKLLEGLRNIKVKAPEKVELNCQIYLGRPTAEVKWYRNSRYCKVFRQIYKYTDDVTDDKISLMIEESDPKDSATYRCEAVNEFGKVRIECIVDVVSGTLRSVTLSAELHCNVPAFYNFTDNNYHKLIAVSHVCL